MKTWTIVISSMMLTASGLSFASAFVPDGGGSAALLIGSVALILLGLVLAVVVKTRQAMPGRSGLDH
ncbi:hypothetical protein [Paenarthrobacter sp. C1]|uniref:hypothetical protein n=1 Tax=Paenarthrobacter sp. C1 TaxID=3400220 RepID=UPI003BF512C1